MLLLATALLSMAPAPQAPPAPVVINEFSYDDSSTDDYEFVELFNASDAPVDLTGWILDSEDPFGPNDAFPITDGTILQPGDYWVMGSDLVPNVDQIVGTTNIWENGQDSLTLRDAGGLIVDTLVYEANKGLWDVTLAEGEGIWGNFTSIAGIETSWSRGRDGLDTDDNGNDFRIMPWTPGTTNDVANLLPYQPDIDAQLVGDDFADWSGSWVAPIVIDPTVVDAANPNVIPASPQGGNAVVSWDPSGGGNHAMFLTDVARDLVLEAWVYFDATLPATGEMQTWSFGLQGSSGTFFNTPDPGGSLGYTANGNTGVNWTYQITDAGGVLYLVDNNNGGWGTDAIDPATILGQIAIEAGVNDGWQRLRLQVSGGMADGRFGGTYGLNDGQSIAAPVTGSFGGIWVSYREFVSDNATARPLTFDGLWVEAATSNLTVSGDGLPGGTLTFDVAEAPPMAFAAVMLSPCRGNFSVMLGMMGGIDFGIMFPMFPVAAGFTGMDGAFSKTICLPSHHCDQVTLYSQALTIDLEFTMPEHGGMHPPGPPPCPRLSFGTSDVEGFLFGAPPVN